MPTESSRNNEFDADSGLADLFLAGDVMTGRGIDQILPHSVDPRLHEQYVQDARQYVRLAERKHGKIPDQVPYPYIWGGTLEILREIRPDARIINLETAVTTHDKPSKNKAIHYRMHPGNVKVLAAAGIDCCILGNNHVLDWQVEGLRQTLSTLHQTDIETAGAGMNRPEAMRPAKLDLEAGRLLVFSYGFTDAGLPPSWNAGKNEAGVNVLKNPGTEKTDRVIDHIKSNCRSDDLVIISLHWGGNWGYHIPQSHQTFARRLIDNEAADLVFGHSSHHPKGIEVYQNRLILYGCGDLINDYEGISGREKYRSDIRLMYLPRLQPSGELAELRMVPLTSRRFRLVHATDEQSRWITEILNRECEKFDLSLELNSKGYIETDF